MVIVAVIFLPMIDMLNTAFVAEYKNRMNVQAKEARENALSRMTSILKEASRIADGPVTIKTEKGTHSISSGNMAVIAYVPVYDKYTHEVSQSGGQTEFNGFAYALIPETDYFDNGTSGKYVMVEASINTYCTPSETSDFKPDSDCVTDWSSGQTNVLFEGAMPALMPVYDSPFSLSSSNDVDYDNIEVAFGVKDGIVYYPSTSGTSLTEDKIQSINIFCRSVTF
jgi:hypothetical protein